MHGKKVDVGDTGHKVCDICDPSVVSETRNRIDGGP